MSSVTSITMKDKKLAASKMMKSMKKELNEDLVDIN